MAVRLGVARGRYRVQNRFCGGSLKEQRPFLKRRDIEIAELVVILPLRSPRLCVPLKPLQPRAKSKRCEYPSTTIQHLQHSQDVNRPLIVNRRMLARDRYSLFQRLSDRQEHWFVLKLIQNLELRV